MKENILTKRLIYAFTKGYKICKKGNVYNPNSKLMKGNKSSKGYITFCIRFEKKPTNISIHRLQAYQKYGDKIFEEGIQVRHFIGDSLDNSWDNILIGTVSDNHMDKSKKVRTEVATNASRAYQDKSRAYEDRCLIYDDLMKGVSYKEIMIKHKVSSKGTLSFMKNKSQEFKDYQKSLSGQIGKAV